VRSACERIARRTVAVCPTLFPRDPRGGGVTVRPLIDPRYEGYLINFNAGFATDDAGHLLIGAQPRPIMLRPVRASPQLALRGKLVELRRAAVGGADAVVLRARPYPQGGLHGDHLVLLWNASGRGLLVSLHFTDRRRPDRFGREARIEAALRIAESFEPVPASSR
jgi:hypothetical protein